MQGIADDLCNRTIVGKYHISHAGKIFIEERPKHFRLERLYQRGKARDSLNKVAISRRCPPVE